MAIKQRALMKLDMTKKHVLHVMRTWNKVALGEVYRDLTEARDLYREGLPRSGYAAYGEIYDGLILAVQKVMVGGEADFQEEVLALCQELLEHLERETAKETRFKKEIFFLPYKLSMFDSLESVWRAADEDKEHCNAYVMPIPYADRNPDQTVAAWHCERDQFPKDVPTLDWQQVDLKVWHPDIVVYHSPYDDGNAVTSVDEQYYSRNLRYCADKLVYIPYFVLNEIEPGDEGAEEGIAHFILAPGVLNADLIVVQSEKMRQVYINVLSRYTNQGEEYWQAHVSGAGSPKIEKVLTSKKEDFGMPEKWRNLVEGRKVILYNTSLSAMLQNSDKVCDKLRYVFDVFRNRNDVVLWWRPHPLMKATFHSMRPQFEEEYLGLEKQYIEEGWGIYDDSSDLHRAICWSDAYYGDRSSVVELYQVTNKPIMLQNVRIVSDDGSCVGMDNVVDYCGQWWFLNFYDNCIYRMDKETFVAEFVVKIPYKEVGPKSDVLHLYGEIYILNEKIFVIPWREVPVVVYDLHSDTLRYIDYGCDESVLNMAFYGAEYVKNKLILIPCCYDSILEIDIQSEEICKIDLEEYINCDDRLRYYAWGSVYREKSKIYFGMLYYDYVVCYDVIKRDVSVTRHQFLQGGTLGICGDENKLWFLLREQDIIRCVSKNNCDVKTFDELPQNFESVDKKQHMSFYKMYLIDEDLYLLPCQSNMAISINHKTNKMEECQVDTLEGIRHDDSVTKAVRCPCMWTDEQNIYMVQTKSRKVYCRNRMHSNVSLKEIELNVAKEFIPNGNSVKYERETLFDNVNVLSVGGGNVIPNKTYKKVGEEIYRLMKC